MSEEMKMEEVMTEEAAAVTEESTAEESTTEEPAVSEETVSDSAAQEEAAAEPAQETDAAEPAQETDAAEPAQETDAAESAQETDAAEPAESMADYEEHLDDANPWNKVLEYMKEKTVLPVKVEGVVNGGVIAMVEDLRGFIPASKLSLSYIENLEDYLLKDIEVQVIDVDQAKNRLILSARDILRAKEKQARADKIANIKVGTVFEGVVETLQNYGAFVKLENDLSGLVHVSQISSKRVKMPSDVLKVGDAVKAKVIAIKDGKISLSMKVLEEKPEEEVVEKVVIPKSENIGTSLGDLFKDLKL